MKSHVPSSTAALVALGSLCVLREKSILWDPAVEPLLGGFLSNRTVPWKFRALASFCQWKIFRLFLRKGMDVFIPGMFAHYVARKVFIEAQVRADIHQGARQIVVIAGGFDTLAVRLAREFPSLPVVEIDHPATQAAKRAALEDLGQLPGNLTLVPADLEKTSLESSLTAGGVSQSVRTIYVLEGVLMYLTAENVVSLFRSLASHGDAKSDNSACVFTCMAPRTDGHIAFEGGQVTLVAAWLGMQKERFLWGLPSDRAAEFFAATGWTTEKFADAVDLARTANFGEHPHLHLAQGEYVVVARRKHESPVTPPA